MKLKTLKKTSKHLRPTLTIAVTLVGAKDFICTVDRRNLTPGGSTPSASGGVSPSSISSLGLSTSSSCGG